MRKNYDDLAFGMQEVMDNEDYQKIFAKPKIATASKKQNEAHEVFNALISLSGTLDELGLSNTSLHLLKTAQSIFDKEQIDEMEEPDVSKYLEDLDVPEKSEGDLDDVLRELGEGGGTWNVDKEPLEEMQPDPDKKMSLRERFNMSGPYAGSSSDKLEEHESECKNCGGDHLTKECPDMGDINDVFDKPTDKDKTEGNPEC